MNTINWEEIIKYGIAMALAGGIGGGGVLIDKSGLEDAYQSKLNQLAKIVQLHANDCGE